MLYSGLLLFFIFLFFSSCFLHFSSSALSSFPFPIYIFLLSFFFFLSSSFSHAPYFSLVDLLRVGKPPTLKTLATPVEWRYCTRYTSTSRGRIICWIPHRRDICKIRIIRIPVSIDVLQKWWRLQRFWQRKLHWKVHLNQEMYYSNYTRVASHLQ